MAKKKIGKLEKIEIIKPCPFCGGIGKIDRDVDILRGVSYYYGICSDCYCKGPGNFSQEGARKAWNNRPGEKK